MKKSLSILALLIFAFCISLYSMEDRENTGQNSYVIECKDNKKLNITSQQYELLNKFSQTIINLVDVTDEKENTIPLLDLEDKVISHLLTLLNQPFDSFSLKKYENYIDQLSHEPLTFLIQLLNAAFYLDLGDKIISLFAETIAHKIVYDTTPKQRSLLQQIFKKVTRSEKIVEYLKSNNDELEKIPLELKSIIATHIINQNPTATLYVKSCKTMTFPDYTITALTWHPNNPFIVSFAIDIDFMTGLLCLINLTNKESSSERSHAKISKLILSKNKKIAAFSNQNIQIWEPNTKAQWAISDVPQSIYTVSQWSPDETKLAVGYEDGTLCIYEQNLNNQWTSPTLLGHYHYITHLQWNNTTLLSLDRNGKIIIWKQDSNKQWILKSTLRAQREYKDQDHLHPYADVSIYPGHIHDKTAITLRLKKRKEYTLLHGHTTPVKHVAWNSAGNYLASASDKDINIWITLLNYFPRFSDPKNPHAKPLTIEQALLLLDWYYSKRDNTSFEILKELSGTYQELPEAVKTFLTSKDQLSIIKS